MAEYIFKIDKVIYNDATGEGIMKPEVVSELIRCKDCKYHHYEGDIPYCANIYGWKDNDFCSKAERREDG